MMPVTPSRYFVTGLRVVDQEAFPVEEFASTLAICCLRFLFVERADGAEYVPCPQRSRHTYEYSWDTGFDCPFNARLRRVASNVPKRCFSNDSPSFPVRLEIR
jgi:hypothetical protein